MRQVVTMIADGLSLKEIGQKLGLSVRTVEWHWRTAKGKLGFRSYVDAVHYAIKHRLINLH